MAQTYKAVVLNERPTGDIEIGKTFRTETKTIPKEADLQEGEAIVETLYMSVDPAMRGWLDDTRSYLPPVPVGAVMRGAIVAKVIASKSDTLTAGDNILSYGGWAEYHVINTINPALGLPVQKLPNMPGVQPLDFLGALGTTALTAYFGLLDIGDPKPGETVVVSGAAGATGSVVCQLAKIKGARVVGIAGGEDKVKWLKELGCDEALNYKAADFREQLKKATPSHIDVYFDNVGGDILDMALDRAKEHARFVMCGAISQYNAKEPKGPRNIGKVIQMRIKMQGFIVIDYVSRFGEAQKQLGQWMAEGKLQKKVQIAKGGVEAAPEALKSLFTGANTGKLLVEVKES